MKKSFILSIILLFLTACTGDETAELNKYLSLEWGLIASLTALIIPIILMVFMYLLLVKEKAKYKKIKKFMREFFKEIPYKTTKEFAYFYTFFPSIMVAISVGILILEHYFKFSEIVTILPILLSQLPAAYYDLRTSNYDNLPESQSDSTRYNGLNKNILKREKASITFVSFIALISSYIIIFSFQKSDSFLIYTILFGIAVSVVIYLVLRRDMYINYIKKTGYIIEVNYPKGKFIVHKNCKTNKKLYFQKNDM